MDHEHTIILQGSQRVVVELLPIDLNSLKTLAVEGVARHLVCLCCGY